MAMAMLVALPGLGLHVSAALGIERRLERDDPRPKSFGHRLDDRIAADAERFRQDFGRQMAVAQMPGESSKGERVGGPDFRERLGRGDDLDNAPVLEAQSVAAAQHRGLCEVKHEGKTADAGHRHAATIAVVKIEDDRIGRGARPPARGYDLVGAQHHRLSVARKRGVGRRPDPPSSTLNDKGKERQPACKPGSVWPGLIAPT